MDTMDDIIEVGIDGDANQSRSPCIIDGDLFIPSVSDPESARELDNLIRSISPSFHDKITYLSKTAHIAGSSSNKLLRSYLRTDIDPELSISDESAINLFVYVNRCNDAVRGIVARTAESSGLDKSIDTGLLIAYDDITVEYSKLSLELSGMKADDPHRAPIAKELRSLRTEMLSFKELIAPAIQKVDVKSQITDARAETNNALIGALKLLK